MVKSKVKISVEECANKKEYNAMVLETTFFNGFKANQARQTTCVRYDILCDTTSSSACWYQINQCSFTFKVLNQTCFHF